jgi:hypothetical protein
MAPSSRAIAFTPTLTAAQQSLNTFLTIERTKLEQAAANRAAGPPQIKPLPANLQDTATLTNLANAATKYANVFRIIEMLLNPGNYYKDENNFNRDIGTLIEYHDEAGATDRQKEVAIENIDKLISVSNHPELLPGASAAPVPVEPVVASAAPVPVEPVVASAAAPAPVEPVVVSAAAPAPVEPVVASAAALPLDAPAATAPAPSANTSAGPPAPVVAAVEPAASDSAAPAPVAESAAPVAESAAPAPAPTETQPNQCTNIHWRIDNDAKRVVKHIRWFIQKNEGISKINLKELEDKVRGVLGGLTAKIDVIYPEVSNDGSGNYDNFNRNCGGKYEIKVFVKDRKAIREKYKVNKMTGGAKEKMYVFRVDIPDLNNPKVLLDVSTIDGEAETFAQKKLKAGLGSSGRSVFGPDRVRNINPKPLTVKKGSNGGKRTLKRNRKR